MKRILTFSLFLILLISFVSAQVTTYIDDFSDLDCNGWIKITGDGGAVCDASNGDLRCSGVCSSGLTMIDTNMIITSLPINITEDWSSGSLYAVIGVRNHTDYDDTWNNVVMFHVPNDAIYITDKDNNFVHTCSGAGINSYSAKISVVYNADLSVDAYFNGVLKCSYQYLPSEFPFDALKPMYPYTLAHSNSQVDNFYVQFGQEVIPVVNSTETFEDGTSSAPTYNWYAFSGSINIMPTNPHTGTYSLTDSSSGTQQFYTYDMHDGSAQDLTTSVWVYFPDNMLDFYILFKTTPTQDNNYINLLSFSEPTDGTMGFWDGNVFFDTGISYPSQQWTKFTFFYNGTTRSITKVWMDLTEIPIGSGSPSFDLYGYYFYDAGGLVNPYIDDISVIAGYVPPQPPPTSYSDDFNDLNCENWSDGDCSSAKLYSSFTDLSSSAFNVANLNNDVYTEFYIDFSDPDMTDFSTWVSDSGYNNIVGVQYSSFANDVAIWDTDYNEYHCVYTFTGNTKINLNYLSDGTVNLYANDILICSGTTSLIGQQLEIFHIDSGFGTSVNVDNFYIGFDPLPPPCTPDWSCIGYETCVEPMVNASCNSVTDLNTCGEVYGGDYSEFTPQVCSYPPVNNTGYVPLHSTSDVPAVAIDSIVEVGLEYIKYAGLIAIVGLGVWAMVLI